MPATAPIAVPTPGIGIAVPRTEPTIVDVAAIPVCATASSAATFEPYLSFSSKYVEAPERTAPAAPNFPK